mmetsp:Transcript_136590/g.340622  ORF Transcript_136590/g.340622 Transcript_136590/m.340622 type:complete len:216 (-) Transcript_136590:1389-2036(-)
MQFGRMDFVHQRCSSFEHLVSDVQLSCLVVCPGFLIELGSFAILMHVPQDVCTLFANSRVLQIFSFVHSALQIPQPNGGSCQASAARSQMIFAVWLDITHRLLEVGKCRLVFSLVLELKSALQKDLRQLMRRKGLSQGKGLLPLLEVAMHFKGCFRAATLQKVLSCFAEAAKQAGNMARQKLFVFESLKLLQIQNHTRRWGLPVSLLCPPNVKTF